MLSNTVTKGVHELYKKDHRPILIEIKELNKKYIPWIRKLNIMRMSIISEWSPDSVRSRSKFQ